MPLGLAPRPFAGICPSSYESVGIELHRLANLGPGATAAAVWPTANLAIYIPFRLDVPARLRTVGAYNGAAVSGNIDVGVYRYDGTKVISSGSTAQAGTSTLQTMNVADTDLGPGRYYLAIALDNGTGQIRFRAYSVMVQEAVGILQQASAFPLPSTMTGVAPTNANVPYAFANFGRLL